jgi:hypothetical protein
MRQRISGVSKKGGNLFYGFRYARVIAKTWWRERRGAHGPVYTGPVDTGPVSTGPVPDLVRASSGSADASADLTGEAAL